MKHVFWTFWIQKTLMQVSGWVVGRGATWGGGKGVKSGQIQVLMVVVKKIREFRNIKLIVRNTSNVMIYTKKFDLFGV